MQTDLENNFPSSEIEILAINEIGHESGNDVASEGADLPLLQDTDANSDNLSDTWNEWTALWRDVRIVDADGEPQGNFNLRTDGDLREQDDYDTVRGMIVDAATANRTADSRWQNAREPLDVTNDGFITPVDVLAGVNKLNAGEGGELSATATVDNFYDTTGDNILSPRDILLTVFHLNNVNEVSAADTGSGEPANDNAANDNTADAFFASLAQSQDDDDSDE